MATDKEGCGPVIGIGVAVVGLLGAILLGAGCTAVPAGHVGIVSSFGKVEDQPLDEGLHLIAFWKKCHRESVQTLEDKEIAEVPTKKGLSVQLEVSLLYSVDRAKAVDIYRTVGAEYKDKIVIPQFRSALRDVTAKFEAEDLYTANRGQIESALTQAILDSLAQRGIICQAVLLRDVKLPQSLRERIEAKLAADQDAQRMEYVLKKETQEAERRRVEAKGIADAQAIIKKDLDHNYLCYLWIRALEESAKHNNATIYIPTGGDGMPMFKGVK